MKIFVVGSALLAICIAASSSLSSAATADGYQCFARPNPARGFKDAFTVRLDHAGVGGRMSVDALGQTKSAGEVTIVQSLNKRSSKDRASFDQALGLLADSDLTGMSDAQRAQVDVITVFSIPLSDDDVAIYQFASNGQLIGGSIMISGYATACVPQSL